MQPSLSPEELAKYRERTPIAHDDETALCTAAGAAKALAERTTATVKAPDVPNARFWTARLSLPPYTEIHIECERYIDALAFARMVAGAREVYVYSDENPLAGTLSRWQVKWAAGWQPNQPGAHGRAPREPGNDRLSPGARDRLLVNAPEIFQAVCALTLVGGLGFVAGRRAGWFAGYKLGTEDTSKIWEHALTRSQQTLGESLQESVGKILDRKS